MSDGVEIDQSIDLHAENSEKSDTRFFIYQSRLQIYQLNRSRLQIGGMMFAVF